MPEASSEVTGTPTAASRGLECRSTGLSHCGDRHRQDGVLPRGPLSPGTPTKRTSGFLLGAPPGDAQGPPGCWAGTQLPAQSLCPSGKGRVGQWSLPRVQVSPWVEEKLHGLRPGSGAPTGATSITGGLGTPWPGSRCAEGPRAPLAALVLALEGMRRLARSARPSSECFSAPRAAPPTGFLGVSCPAGRGPRSVVGAAPAGPLKQTVPGPLLGRLSAGSTAFGPRRGWTQRSSPALSPRFPGDPHSAALSTSHSLCFIFQKLRSLQSPVNISAFPHQMSWRCLRGCSPPCLCSLPSASRSPFISQRNGRRLPLLSVLVHGRATVKCNNVPDIPWQISTLV